MARTTYTDLQLLDALRQAKATLGRVPSMRDVDRDPSLPASFTFKYRFGSYSEALRRAFGAGVELRAPARRADDAKLAADLRSLAERLGRSPSVSEMNGVRGAYHANTYIRHYGSWRNAVAEILGV